MLISPDYATILVKLVLAAFLGLLVGVEREIHKRPAGLRTHSLVSLGACMFILTVLQMSDNQTEFVTRIMPGIITGIGFLGAGMIFQSKDKIIGLTTAAEIWSLAAVGVMVGIGYYSIAITATVLILVILVPLEWFERKIRTK